MPENRSERWLVRLKLFPVFSHIFSCSLCSFRSFSGLFAPLFFSCKMLTNPANTGVSRCLQVEAAHWNLTDGRGHDGGIDLDYLICGSDS